MSDDTVFLLQAIVTGVLITFGYDWLRIIRRVIPHNWLAVSLEDFLFWLICGVSVFIWMYRVTNGGMRWFAIVGAVFGMFLYKKCVSEWFVRNLSRLLSFLLKNLLLLISILLRPLHRAWSKVEQIHYKGKRKRRKIMDNLKIRLKSHLKALKIRLCKR